MQPLFLLCPCPHFIKNSIYSNVRSKNMTMGNTPCCRAVAMAKSTKSSECKLPMRKRSVPCDAPSAMYVCILTRAPALTTHFEQPSASTFMPLLKRLEFMKSSGPQQEVRFVNSFHFYQDVLSFAMNLSTLCSYKKFNKCFDNSNS